MGSKRAVIYCRQSQDVEGNRKAVDRQEEACRGLATARDWEVVGVEVDNSVSASTGKERPAWARVLELVERHEVDVIIAWHLDRITRTMTDLEHLIVLTQDKGVRVATATGDIDLTTDAGRMVARILAAVARAEVERKGERQRLQNRSRVGEGRQRWSRRPFGFQKDGTHDPHEAPILASLYRSVLAGERLGSLVKRLNADGVLTATPPRVVEREDGSTESVPYTWTTQSLGKLLRNPRNAGIIAYQGKPVRDGDGFKRGTWDPIVDEDTYRVALARMTRSEFTNGGVSGTSPGWAVTVATCGVCGGRVFANQRLNKRTGERMPWHYSCGKGCIWLPQEWVDSRLFLALADILSDGDRSSRWQTHIESTSDVASDLRQRADVLTERLRTFATEFAEGRIDASQMIAGTERVRAELVDVEAGLSAIDAQPSPLGLDPEYLSQELDAMSTDAIRELLRSVMSSVVLHRRGGKGSRNPLIPSLVDVVPR